MAEKIEIAIPMGFENPTLLGGFRPLESSHLCVVDHWTDVDRPVSLATIWNIDIRENDTDTERNPRSLIVD